MLAVARKRQADEIALGRGIVVAQAVVGKVAQLIVAEIENGDRLARTCFLRAVSLIEQRGVMAIGTEGDGRGKAVGAGEIAGDGEGQALAGRKVDAARAIGGARNHEHDKQRGKSEEEDNGDFCHELFRRLFHEQWPREVCTIPVVCRASRQSRPVVGCFEFISSVNCRQVVAS